MLLFLVPQDTQCLCRALSVTNVFVRGTGGVPSHRKMCVRVCVYMSLRRMELGGYSLFFYLACRTVREKGRKTMHAHPFSLPFSPSSWLAPPRWLNVCVCQCVCVCPLACPSVCRTLNVNVCNAMCVCVCVPACFTAYPEIEHAKLGVPLCGCVCVCVRTLSSQGKARGHIGSCDRQPYLSADCIVGILGRHWNRSRRWGGKE